MPSSRHARMIRSAISPRLAISTFFSIDGSTGSTTSQRDVAVLLRRIAIALPLKRIEGLDEARTGIARVDDVVEVAASRRDVRVRELLAIFVDLSIRRALGIRTF